MLIYTRVCGYSLMVKLQPSKLIMRVRFPLPASGFTSRSIYMKIVNLAMAFLLAGSMVSLSSAATAREQAVSMAAENSKSSIDAISLALYEAVLATPSEAVSICEELLSQRGGWSAYECEVLMRAVLLARQHQPLICEDCLRLLRGGRGTHVIVLGNQSQAGVPDTAADHIGSVSRLFQSIDALDNGFR